MQCVAVQVTGRKEIFLKAGLFEDGRRRVEDFDMWLRVIKAGGRIAYHRGVLVRSRRRGDSLSASEEAMLLADIEVCEKARRTLQLTTEELDAMDRQIIRWRAWRNSIWRGENRRSIPAGWRMRRFTSDAPLPTSRHPGWR